MERYIFCKKYQKELLGLDNPPFPSERGQYIFENISQQAWDEWLSFQKKLINEKHLEVRSPETKQYLNEQFEKFINNEPLEKLGDEN